MYLSVAKWLVFDWKKKAPGLNSSCYLAGKVFSLPLHPLGDQPLVERARRYLFLLSDV